MNADRFFSVPYDNRSDVKMLMLRNYDGYAAYGRWIALLGILYDQDGILDMSNQNMRNVIVKELELDDVDEFFNVLAEFELIDSELYHSMNHVVNRGVCDELNYKSERSESGKKGASKRWKKTPKSS